MKNYKIDTAGETVTVSPASDNVWSIKQVCVGGSWVYKSVKASDTVYFNGLAAAIEHATSK